MSTIAPTTEFSPNDVSDSGLAELRSMAFSAMRAAGQFGEWLIMWTDAEQARRHRQEETCTRRHACGLPLMNEWTNLQAAEALEAVGVLVHAVADFSASQFAERLQLAVTMEAAHRLRNPEEGKTENAN